MIIYDENRGIGIDEDGFLENHDFEEYIPRAYKDCFDFMRRLNEYMYSLYNAVEIKSKDKIGCFILGTYNKIHKLVQASIILAARGLHDEVKILLRSILDKLMVMQAVYKDKEHYNSWIDQQKRERYRLIKKIQEGKPGLGNLKDKVPDLKDIDPGKVVTQYDWAQMSEMEDIYNREYALFSGNVHHAACVLESDLIIEDDFITAMDIGPKHEIIGALLATVASYALQASEIIVKYSKTDSAKCEEINKELENIWRQVAEAIDAE